MSRRALDAAGIIDPALRACYEACRRLHADHGKTYYLATLLLPPHKRPHVHALYGFARYADEFVDSLSAPDPEELLRWGGQFLVDLERGHSDDEIGRALIHTARTFDIPHAHFRDFLASMRMDITVTGYATYADLEHYMYGSAAVIGLEMVPILGPLTDEAYPRARALGEAFQLSNFIRDVGEDLRRGRVYLPQEDLDRYGVTRADLARGVVRRPSGRCCGSRYPGPGPCTPWRSPASPCWTRPAGTVCRPPSLFTAGSSPRSSARTTRCSPGGYGCRRPGGLGLPCPPWSVQREPGPDIGSPRARAGRPVSCPPSSRPSPTPKTPPAWSLAAG